jgi:hypothetical protein
VRHSPLTASAWRHRFVTEAITALRRRTVNGERPPNGGPSFPFDNKFLLYNIPGNCYMNADSIARFVGTLLDLIDDFVSEFRTRMIASHLIRSVAATAAKYRAGQRIRYPARVAAKMCLVLEEAEQSSVSLERVERRLSRRLEPVRQAIFVADEIIEKTFSSRRTARRNPAYAIVPNTRFHRGLSRGSFPSAD